jgi:flagellar basal body-associated protein FliL
MKKVIVICMVLAMALTMAVSVFAEPGAFVESPSKNPAPELVEGKNESEACTAQIIITAYGDRNNLTAEQRQKLEEAYAKIVGTQDLSTLNAKVGEIAAEMGVSVSTLAVSDLFDISATDCDGNHAEHGLFDITLKAETLNNFVALLHYYNGEWRVIDNAEITNNGEYLEFTEKEFSPFAIVVSTADIEPQPASNNFGWIIAIIVAVIIILAFIWFLLFYRKKKEEEEEEAQAEK